MTLTAPKNNGFVGGVTKLIFTSSISSLSVKINNSPVVFSGSANIYEIDLNIYPADVPIQIAVKYQDTSATTISESILVYKPGHDFGGMGATVIRDNSDAIVGAFFKLWLPKVASVSVIGSFNGWVKDKFQLNELGNSGYWYGFAPDARPGDDYIFFVTGMDGNTSEVSDPAARDTIKTSHNQPDDNDANAVIVDPQAFNWLYDRHYEDRRQDFRQHIIYQLHWGTFFRPDSSGSVPLAFETFTTGATEDEKRNNVSKRLKYISNLGFTAIELLPVHEANGAFNGGYDPSFFFAVETAYGTPDDLRILVDEAHRLGLAVFFDAVINHLTNDESHSSFSQEFIKGWYTKENAPWSNHRLFGGSDWGPDPDFDRGEIRSLLTDCMQMYFDEYHVDGIRFDATTTIPRDAIESMMDKLQADYRGQGKFFIAEHITDNPFPYIVGDIGFDAGWYKPAFYNSIDRVVGAVGRGSFQHLRSTFETNYNGEPDTAIKYLLGSHDEIWKSHGGRSAVKRFGGSGQAFARMKMRLAWALNVCALGTPMMFMGTELMTDIGWDNYHGYNNTNSDLQGNPGLNWNPPIGSDSANFQQMVREINNLHQSLGALRTANTDCKLVHVDNDRGVFAYKRWDYFGCILLIVINISDAQWERREYQLNTDTPNSSWREVFNSQYYTYGGWVGSDNSDPSFYPSANNSGWLQGINVPKWSLSIFKQQL